MLRTAQRTMCCRIERYTFMLDPLGRSFQINYSFLNLGFGLRSQRVEFDCHVTVFCNPMGLRCTFPSDSTHGSSRSPKQSQTHAKKFHSSTTAEPLFFCSWSSIWDQRRNKNGDILLVASIAPSSPMLINTDQCRLKYSSALEMNVQSTYIQVN